MTIGCLTQKTETAIAPGLALKLTLKLVRQSRSKQASDRGLTLIEGLIAIIIVTITVVSISPPIFWATASRVQTRRAEQALQLAQGEIDRVRAMIDRGDITTANVVDLPPTKAGFDEAQARDPSQALAPNAAKTAGIVTSAKDSQCQSAQQQRDGDVRAGIPTDIRQYIQVDLNADCQADFLVQTFRSEGLDSTGAQVVANNTAPAGFVMGVRVYAFVAKNNLDQGKGQTEAASLKGTSGLGNQELRPLAVLYSTIVSSSASGNLDLYQKLCPASDAANDKPRC